MISTTAKWLCATALCTGLWTHAAAQTAAGAGDSTIVVTLLGTGSPEPSAERFSHSTLVQVAGKTLLFDAGRGASIRMHQIGASMGKIDGVFLTHYHSDHTIGLADVWLTGWLPPYGGRQAPLKVHGPKGVKQLVDGLRLAYKDDVDIRLKNNFSKAGSELAHVTFDNAGVVLDTEGVKVEAFRVTHGEHVDEAYGYKVSYRQRSVVISGDTSKSDNVIQAAKGSDLLVHEVALAAESIRDLPLTKLVMALHVSPEEAGEVFTASKPKLAAYTHLVFLKGPKDPTPTEQQIVDETRKTYRGPLVVGQDLTRFVIGDTVRVQQFNVQARAFTDLPQPASYTAPK